MYIHIIEAASDEKTAHFGEHSLLIYVFRYNESIYL